MVESIWLLSHSHEPMGSLGSITGLTARASRNRPEGAAHVRSAQASPNEMGYPWYQAHSLYSRTWPLRTLRAFIAANAGVAKILCLWGRFGYKTSLKIRNKQ